jgi:hypothetical protein
VVDGRHGVVEIDPAHDLPTAAHRRPPSPARKKGSRRASAPRGAPAPRPSADAPPGCRGRQPAPPLPPRRSPHLGQETPRPRAWSRRRAESPRSP